MKSKQRRAVEIAREDLDQAIVVLERATRRETEASPEIYRSTR